MPQPVLPLLLGHRTSRHLAWIGSQANHNGLVSTPFSKCGCACVRLYPEVTDMTARSLENLLTITHPPIVNVRIISKIHHHDTCNESSQHRHNRRRLLGQEGHRRNPGTLQSRLLSKALSSRRQFTDHTRTVQAAVRPTQLSA